MESFEEVSRLDTPALRALLAGGRPDQRVWAIWALALRTGGIVGVADAVGDPDAGVRRTIAVMLAAHGEHEMLVTLARHDPVRAVRESAMQLVARLAAQGAIEAAVVLEAARTDPGVHGAILAAIGRGTPPFLVELATELLQSRDPDVQADAFEALVRTESADVCRIALTWLETLPPPRVRSACHRMVHVVGDYAFACELARASRRVREVALRTLRAPTWPAVEQLVGDDVELIVAIAREGTIEVPITALARAALDGQAGPLVERLAAELAQLDAPSDELRPLLPQLARHYGEWIAALDRDTDDDDRRRASLRARARRRLEALRAELERLQRA